MGQSKEQRPGAAVETRASATAKYISGRNAEAVVGQGYRWCRDKAHELGVRVLNVGDKRLIPAAEFFAALERASVNDAKPVEPTEQDATAAVFAALGWQVRK